jgi:hypothetical protein
MKIKLKKRHSYVCLPFSLKFKLYTMYSINRGDNVFRIYISSIILFNSTHLLMDETLGMLSSLQTPSFRRRSRISQANIDGHSRLYVDIFCTTSEVATRGFEPPIARGLIEPVS